MPHMFITKIVGFCIQQFSCVFIFKPPLNGPVMNKFYIKRSYHKASMLLSAPVLYKWLCMHKHTNFKLKERNFCHCGRLFETIEYILQTADKFDSIISNEHKRNQTAFLIPIQFRLL